MPELNAEQPLYFAMDLAESFLSEAQPDADEPTRDRVRSLVLCAGQHLADDGCPGAWHRFDPESFLDKMPVGDERELVEMCLDLVGLYGWLGTAGLLEPMTCAEILARVRAVAPDQPILRDLIDRGVAMLGELSDLAGDRPRRRARRKPGSASRGHWRRRR